MAHAPGAVGAGQLLDAAAVIQITREPFWSMGIVYGVIGGLPIVLVRLMADRFSTVANVSASWQPASTPGTGRPYQRKAGGR